MAKLSMSIKVFAAGLAIFSILSPQQVMAAGETIRQFGTAGYDNGVAIAQDNTGVYITGHTDGSFSGYTNAGEDDAFLTKFDHQGNRLWTRQFGSSQTERAYSVVTHGSSVYVAGSIYPTGFVRKYDRNGNEIWTQAYNYGTSGLTYIIGLAFDDNYIYTAAMTEGAAPGQSHIGGQYDIVVQKSDLSGNEVWSRQFGGTDNDFLTEMVITSSDIYFTGFISNALPGQVSNGSLDGFVSKYTKDGVQSWTRQFGTTGDDFGNGIGTDGQNIYIVGTTNGILSNQPNAGEYDAYVQKIDSDGNELWTRQFGSSTSDEARGIAISADRVYASGVQNAAASINILDASNGNQLKTYRYPGAPVPASGGPIQDITVNSTSIYGAGAVTGNFTGQVSNGGEDAFFLKQRLDDSPVPPLPPVVCTLLPILCS